MVPVKTAPYGEELVFGAWIGNVPYKRVDVFGIGLGPFPVNVANRCCRQDMIAVVEVMVVVVRIAKVDTRVSRYVACR